LSVARMGVVHETRCCYALKFAAFNGVVLFMAAGCSAPRFNERTGEKGGNPCCGRNGTEGVLELKNRPKPEERNEGAFSVRQCARCMRCAVAVVVAVHSGNGSGSGSGKAASGQAAGLKGKGAQREMWWEWVGKQR